MNTNTLWHILQNELEIIKKETEPAHHIVLDKAFTSIKRALENFIDEQVIAGLPHPHPRSRIYRSEPKEWDIQDTSSDKIFETIVAKVKNCTKPPICVFDLDGTVFDVGFRTLGIIQEWLVSDHAKQFNETLTKKAAKISYEHVGYSLSHAFENAGFDLRNHEAMNLFASIEKNWKKKFFDEKSLIKFDQLIPGSDQFVQKIHNNNIEIFYLTGRHFKLMHQGTLEQLQKFELPLKSNNLIMKKVPFIEDQIFKAEVIKTLSQQYDIIGNFENEYLNIAFMAMEAPKATHVIVDSQHSGRDTPELSNKIYRIKSY